MAIGRDGGALTALIGAMFAVALGVGFILPLLPVYADTLGASGIWIGLIFGANPFARALLMLLFGSLSDRWGKKLFISWGMGGYLLVSLGFALAGSPLHLLLMRLLQGVFSAMIVPVARAYAGELSLRGREGSVMGLLSLGFFAGHAGGPVMGGLVADRLGIQAVFYLMGALVAVALVTILLFLPERVSRTTAREEEPSLTTRAMLRNPVIKGLITIRGSVALGRGIFSTLLPIFAQVAVGLSATQIGLLISLRALVASLLQPVFGWLADRYSRKHLAVGGFCLSPLCLALLPWSSTLLHLLLLAVILGISTGISVPAANAIAVEQGRVFRMGAVMGLLALGQSLSMASGALLGGYLMDAAGLPGSFRVAAFISLAGILLSTWFLRSYRQTTSWAR